MKPIQIKGIQAFTQSAVFEEGLEGYDEDSLMVTNKLLNESNIFLRRIVKTKTLSHAQRFSVIASIGASFLNIILLDDKSIFDQIITHMKEVKEKQPTGNWRFKL